MFCAHRFPQGKASAPSPCLGTQAQHRPRGRCVAFEFPIPFRSSAGGHNCGLEGIELFHLAERRPAVSKRLCCTAMGSLDTPAEENPLLEPFQLGKFSLSHRIVLAPLTRMRSHDRIPQPASASLYYSQRTTPGGFLIAEATSVSDDADGYPRTPGVWTEEQVEAWKPIVKAVHDKGGIFFLQLWHTGRVSNVAYKQGGQAPVSSTNKAAKGFTFLPDGTRIEYSQPRALEKHEIPNYVEQFRHGARNAIRAGFDGVEVHGAHGYLIDQFLRDGINDRTDEYGGSLENRARFALEVVKAVSDEIGADRVGIRLSPWTAWADAVDSDPLSLALYLAKELSKLKILYLHLVEPRMENATEGDDSNTAAQSLRPVRDAFNGAFLAAGGYTRQSGIRALKAGDVDLVVYGRWFLANPDLVERFRRNVPLNKYNRDTFYTPHPVVGYTDYPFLES